MTAANDGDMTCPKCGHSNPPKSSYCWECRFDFVPDDLPHARVSPPVSHVPVPPPYSPVPVPPPYSRPQAEAKVAGDGNSVTVFAIELIASTMIIGSSWFVLSFIYPSMDAIRFAAGWGAAVLLVVFSEGRLRDPETELKRYWSRNPFEYRDDGNRSVLKWHIVLFLPRVVLRTIRSGFALVSAR